MIGTTSSRGLQLFGVVALLVAGVAAGCGGNSKSGDTAPTGDDAGQGSEGGSFGDGGLIGSGTIKSMVISPANATITSNNGAPVTQPYTLNVTYANGTVTPVSAGVTWTTDSPVVGAIDSTGLYTANGSLGGVVQVSASFMGQSASAPLIVKLLVQKNPGNVSGAAQAGLQGATTPDANVVWAYPYDGTVWARGLLPPTLQWNGGAATDDYYVHLVSQTFELQEFTTATGAPSSQLLLDATTWGQFTDSTSGATQVTVARWDGTKGTLLANHVWTIAPASIRSTIYYWSNNLGRVLRIQPGAASPDDFALAAPLNDPTQYQQDSCLMTCHTVSADGSTLVSGGGTYGGSYDLGTDQPIHSLGGTWGYDPNTAGVPVWNNIQWEVPALSPTGKYILTDSMAQSGVTDENGPSTIMGLFTTADGLPVANSGVSGSPFASPAWSPEGSRVAFVSSGDPSGWTAAGYNWQNPPPGDLDVIQFDETKNPMFSGQQTMVSHLLARRELRHTQWQRGPLLRERGDAQPGSAPREGRRRQLSLRRRRARPLVELRAQLRAGRRRRVLLGRLHEPPHVRKYADRAGRAVWHRRVGDDQRELRVGPELRLGLRLGLRMHDGDRGQATLGRRHRPEPETRRRSQPRRVPPRGAGRDQPRDARLHVAPAVRGRRAKLHVGHRLLRRLLLERRGRRPADVPIDAERLFADRRQVQHEQRLLQRRFGCHVHRARVLGADAAVSGARSPSMLGGNLAGS
jgi:hypothetical protein